jgi:NADPH:quinone reductase-like Zn-dependent oxidoreductase
VPGSNELVLVSDAPCWSNSISVSKKNIHKLETNLSVEEAAALPALLSAWAIYKQIGNLQSGDSVIQTDSETALGQAFSQLMKAHNVNVISVSQKELADVSKFQTDMKTHKNIKAAIVGSSGKFLHALMKVISANGDLICYQGTYQSLENTSGIDIPIGRAIFQGVKIRGFDYANWFKNNSSEWENGLKEISKLLKEKKITVKVNMFDPKDYSKAIQEVETTGKLNAFKF